MTEATMKNQAQTIRAPMATVKPEIKVDLSELSETDLGSLERQDPFMYYSIPAVRRAKLFFEEVDHSEVASSLPSQVVSRQSRVTTECDAILLLDDLLNMSEEEFAAEFRELQLDESDLFDGIPPSVTRSNADKKR
mmetsp:Transcript_50732/g.108129  ORF Transcript_50732/g.108129 Transcript_50732/m.108129 type:complete len:136 (-) Transcript_50732:277-684(-)